MCCLGGFSHCRGLSQSPRSYSSGLQSFSLSEAHTQCLVPRGSAPKKGDIRFEMLSKREKIGLSNRKQTSRGPLAPAEGQDPSASSELTLARLSPSLYIRTSTRHPGIGLPSSLARRDPCYATPSRTCLEKGTREKGE